MKIIVIQERRTFTLEIDEDLDVYEMADEMKLLLYAMMYHPDSIGKVFVEEE